MGCTHLHHALSRIRRGSHHSELEGYHFSIPHMATSELEQTHQEIHLQSNIQPTMQKEGCNFSIPHMATLELETDAPRDLSTTKHTTCNAKERKGTRRLFDLRRKCKKMYGDLVSKNWNFVNLVSIHHFRRKK